MKTTIIIRLALVASHLLLLRGLSGPVFELEGFGEYDMTGLTKLGTSYLKYGLWAAVAAFVVLPLRFGYLLSGLVMGGLAMIGLTVVRDVIELATMDTELPKLSEIVHLLWGGKLICWSCGLVVLADLAALALGEWKWTLRTARTADRSQDSKDLKRPEELEPSAAPGPGKKDPPSEDSSDAS